MAYTNFGMSNQSPDHWDSKKKISQSQVDFIRNLLMENDRGKRDILTSQLMAKWREFQKQKALDNNSETFVTQPPKCN
ncbi:hypothetical protein EB796_009252 [Bugula neritina]|uniref:Uncharacterized protein n=1 Tax=Bugula neritina TaxID=10212 RepID=A0A7J7K4B2_BUGNE|nr:hypothetical protein EB796_009252 [Bugula neritina]